MSYNISFMELPLNTNPSDTYQYFISQTKADPKQASKAYQKAITKTQNLCMEHLKCFVKYTFLDISEISDTQITLSDGSILKGSILPKVLSTCQQVLLYVLTLNGFQDLADHTEKIIDQFFLDAWGTAYTQALDNDFNHQMRTEQKNNGHYTTISWNPGQAKLPLQNQEVLFRILKPEDIGLTLTSSKMMSPLKSLSGIVGISTEPQDESLISCDFCSMNQTCPLAYSGRCE